MKKLISKITGILGTACFFGFIGLTMASILPFFPHTSGMLYTFYAITVGMVFFGGMWMSINFD